MNPDRSVLALTALLLVKLRKNRIESYSALFTYAKKEMIDGDTLFSGALSLLYLLGLIKYHSLSDTFEYVER